MKRNGSTLDLPPQKRSRFYLKVSTRPMGQFNCPMMFHDGHDQAGYETYEEQGQFFGDTLAAKNLTMEDIRKDPVATLPQLVEPAVTSETEEVIYARMVALQSKSVSKFKKDVASSSKFKEEWKAKHKALFNHLWTTPDGRRFLIYIGQTSSSLLGRHASAVAHDNHYFDFLQACAETSTDLGVQSLGYALIATAGMSQDLIDNIERGLILSVGLERTANIRLMGVGSPLKVHSSLYYSAPGSIPPDRRIVLVMDTTPRTGDNDHCRSITNLKHIFRVTGAFPNMNLPVIDARYYRYSNDKRPPDPKKYAPITDSGLLANAHVVIIFGVAAVMCATYLFPFLSPANHEAIKNLPFGGRINFRVQHGELTIVFTYHPGRGAHFGPQATGHAAVQSSIGASLVIAHVAALGGGHNNVVKTARQVIEEVQPDIETGPKGAHTVFEIRDGEISRAAWKRSRYPGTFFDWCRSCLYLPLAQVRTLMGENSWLIFNYTSQMTQIAIDDPEPKWLTVNPRNGADGKKDARKTVAYTLMQEPGCRFHIELPSSVRSKMEVRVVVDSASVRLLNRNDREVFRCDLRSAWDQASLKVLVQIALLRGLVEPKDLEVPKITNFFRKQRTSSKK
ncbi:hypothetical protein MVEN_02418700 [Mycena venus]|uniref:Uncharacterized protein n=1 Tax=Mycena venus TaxID=2733690 RepID=A0A8H6WY33_9AGAR|nr:hypothetical protein MVEN_02418700 [Mycena venus]